MLCGILKTMKRPIIISGISLILPFVIIFLLLLIDYQDDSRAFAYLAAVFSVFLAIGPVVSFLQGKHIIQAASAPRARVFGGVVCLISLIFFLFGVWSVYAIIKAIASVSASQPYN